MQRMRLHTQGVKLPTLGSIEDRVLRQFEAKSSELEAKKMQFQMLLLLTNPDIKEDSKWREWRGSVKSVWSEYIGLLYNTEVPEHGKEEQKLIDFYNNSVKNSQLKMFRDAKTGELKLTGLETLQL